MGLIDEEEVKLEIERAMSDFRQAEKVYEAKRILTPEKELVFINEMLHNHIRDQSICVSVISAMKRLLLKSKPND